MSGPIVRIAAKFGGVVRHASVGIHVRHIESSIQRPFVLFRRWDGAKNRDRGGPAVKPTNSSAHLVFCANPGGLNEAVTNLGRRFGSSICALPPLGRRTGWVKRCASFSAPPGEAGDLRVVWVVGAAAPDGDGSVCPAWNEDPVRPAVPSILVAPECLKYLVQAPSTYERASGPEEALLPVGQPGVVFVSLPVEFRRRPDRAPDRACCYEYGGCCGLRSRLRHRTRICRPRNPWSKRSAVPPTTS